MVLIHEVARTEIVLGPDEGLLSSAHITRTVSGFGTLNLTSPPQSFVSQSQLPSISLHAEVLPPNILDHLHLLLLILGLHKLPHLDDKLQSSAAVSTIVSLLPPTEEVEKLLGEAGGLQGGPQAERGQRGGGGGGGGDGGG